MLVRCTLVVLTFALSLDAGAQTADLIVTGAVVHTVDDRYPQADALAVKNGRILAVGSSEELLALQGAKTRIVDAEGAFLMPGFVEGHGHYLGLGTMLRSINLMDCKSYGEVVARVTAAARRLPKGEWITGRGWDQNEWPDKIFPHHQPLSEAVPDHPVLLTRVDGHAALANGLALELAGVNGKTPAPRGGELITDRSGNLTGVLIDKAIGLVAAATPSKETPQSMKADLLRAQARCFSEGITSFHDAGTNRGVVELMEQLYASNELKIRLYVMLRVSSPATAVRAMRKAPIVDAHGGRLTVRSLKISIDGALGSRGAAMLEDYSDREGHKGLLMLDRDELAAISEIALNRGYQVNVHAIGDRANRTVLDAFEQAYGEDILRGREARFRIEHAQIVDEADIPRFRQLGVIASIQGVHCSSDRPWVPTRIGEERTREGAYVWRKFLREGVVVNNGTDAPVENVSALASLHATITRRRPDGTPGPDGFDPDQRLTRREAIYSYTQAGAIAAFQEHDAGSLTPGKRADFILLDKNLLTCPEDEILTAKVQATYVAGERVYRRRP